MSRKEVDWQIAVLQLLQAKFPPSTWISFTKLNFRWSFWGAEWVCILIGSKVMTQNANFSIFVVVRFCKTKKFVCTVLVVLMSRMYHKLSILWSSIKKIYWEKVIPGSTYFDYIFFGSYISLITFVLVVIRSVYQRIAQHQ